jgi:branched-subunit amino acid transport protein
MTVWIAVLVAGACSYAFRALPLLLGARIRLSERHQRTLRHAGMGGMAALLASSIAGIGRTDGAATLAAAVVAVVAGGALAVSGRSMMVVLCGGGASFALVAGITWALN